MIPDVRRFREAFTVHHHHVVIDKLTGEVVAIGESEFAIRRRYQDFSKSAPVRYRRGELAIGDPYDDAFAPGGSLVHGVNDGEHLIQ